MFLLLEDTLYKLI